MQPIDGLPRVRIGQPMDDIAELLQSVREAILTHPAAAQAIFAALVREGRAFAKTPEGRREMEILQRSELVHRARLVLELSSSWLLDDDTAGPLPSALVDALFLAAGQADAEELLARTFDGT